jgi:Cu/Ag efflux pump CusA
VTVVRAWVLVLVAFACHGRQNVESRRIEAPFVVVMVSADGRDPASLEHDIAIPLEHELAALPGLAHVRTSIDTSVVALVLELRDGADVFATRSEVMSHLEHAETSLPPGALPMLTAPTLRNAAVLRYLVTSDRVASAELRAWNDTVVRSQLERVAGVSDVGTCGGDRTRITIDVDPAKLAALDLAVGDVATAVHKANVALPGGVLTSSSTTLAVRTDSLDPAALAALVVGQRNGVSIALRDLATIQVAPAPPSCRAVGAGGAIIAGAVYVQFGADPFEVRGAVEAALVGVRASTPPGVTLTVLPRTTPIALVVDLSDANDPARVLDTIRRALGSVPGVDAIVVELGQPDGGPVFDAGVARLRIVPPNDADRRELEARALDALRAPGLAARTPDALVIQILGPDLVELERVATTIMAIPRATFGPPIGMRRTPVQRETLDRPALARYGIDVADVTDAIAAQSETGLGVGEAVVATQSVPIVVRLRSGGSPAAEVRVRPSSPGGLVPLDTLVTREITNEPAEIRREDGVRWVGVRVASNPDAVRDAVGELKLPPGYRLRLVTGDP